MSDVVALVPVAGLSGLDPSFVEHAVALLVAADSVDDVVVLAEPGFTVPGYDVRVLSGSTVDVAHMIAAEAGVVLVHDPMRPLMPSNVVDRVVHAVLAHGRPVVPVLPCSDTVKVLDPSGVVIDTLDRATLRVSQTPLGYPARMVLDGTVVPGEVPAGALTVAGDPSGRRLASAVDRAMIRS
jgi:2-C-methyl-D-erythritol 4-phosphate cytidylyltransferase